MFEGIEYLLRRIAPSKRETGAAHLGMRCRIVEQPGGRRDDPIGIGADERQIAAGERFGALGGIAEHQCRYTERGSFFLNAATVGEDQPRRHHDLNGFSITQRSRQRDRRVLAKTRPHDGPNRRVKMDRAEQADVTPIGKSERGVANMGDACTDIVAPKAGEEDKIGRVTEGDAIGQLLSHRQQCIDAGIARHDNTAAHVRLIAQVPRGGDCWSEEPIGQLVDRDPVALLWPGMGEVMGAQPRFDMRDRQSKMRGGEGASLRQIGIALHDHEIWCNGRQD